MKIYTAGSFSDQARIRSYKEPLLQLGHSVLSTWIYEQVKPTAQSTEQFNKKMAMKDLLEIAEADCLILDLENPSKTMGKMVEYGFAIAKHKLVYVVAPNDSLTSGHIFMLLSDKIFKSWEELFEYFKENHK